MNRVSAQKISTTSQSEKPFRRLLSLFFSAVLVLSAFLVPELQSGAREKTEVRSARFQIADSLAAAFVYGQKSLQKAKVGRDFERGHYPFGILSKVEIPVVPGISLRVAQTIFVAASSPRTLRLSSRDPPDSV